MKIRKNIVAVALVAWMMSFTVKAEVLDRIVAVVEEDVILDQALTFEVNTISKRLKANDVPLPPLGVLRAQVLDRLIIDKLQHQLAERSGIRVTDEMLKGAVADIANRNGLGVEGFRQELASQNIDFSVFENNIRSEIITNQLRAREIGSRIKVTDREVLHYLETQGEVDEGKVEYDVGHILISIPEAAAASVIQKAKKKADKIITELRGGDDFANKAVAVSEGGNALKGGGLGWRTIGQMPTLFVGAVTKMNEGDIAEPIRSPSGFHIIKLLAKKGAERHIVTKTKARHILIQTNELVDDEEAQKKLQALKERAIDGDDFASLARSNSDDKGSAINGGSLGWVGSGALVPPFEEAMNNLALNEISDPVQTQFGWHMIQVLEREDKDNSVEHKKNQVRDEIRKRKIEEETELWLRRLRDEAYVDINTDRL